MKSSNILQRLSATLVAVILACCGIGSAAAIGPGNTGSFPVEVINPEGDPVPTTIVNPESDPVPSVVVNPEESPIPTADKYAPGREPVRIGPVQHSILPSNGIPVGGYEVIDSVDAGRTLILTHLNAIAFSNLSNQPFTEASCTAYLKTPAPGGGNLLTPFLGVPVERAPNGTFFGSMPLFLPLSEGEGLNVLCVGQPLVSQGFRVTAGGYLVPGSE